MSGPAESPAVLTDAVERLSTADTVERITDIVASAARELMAADGATFVLREDDRCVYADEDAIGPLWKGSRFPMTACISGWSMMHRETVVVPDIYEDARIPQEAYRPTFVKSLAMVPIREQDPIGAVGAYWSTSTTPSHEQVRLLQVLANSAAVALENLELRGAVTRRAAERDELESAIHTLVHDLRGPLGAILGCAELLQDEPDPDRARVFGELIVSAGRQLDQQIDRMLGLYRITNTELRPEPVDLSALGGEIVEQLRRRNEREVDVRIEPGLVAHMDPLLADLMLRNLLDNAFKYTGRTPVASISLERGEAGSPLSTFVVRDNGAGFDEADAEQLFKPLVRLHRDSDFPGTGLGLASVARIVELHGGRIRAEGRRHAGATFYLSLPISA